MKDISIRTFANRKAVIVYLNGESVLFYTTLRLPRARKMVNW